jgi:hypothetical protein
MYTRCLFFFIFLCFAAVHAQTLVLGGVAYPAAIAAYGPLVTDTISARAAVADPPEGCIAPSNAATLAGAIVLLSAGDPPHYADGCNAARRNLLLVSCSATRVPRSGTRRPCGAANCARRAVGPPRRARN